MAALIDAGKVQFTFKHLVVLGQESNWAAEASECAADQDTFWAYHDLLFERQNVENRGTFTLENLKGLAKSVVFDTQQFNACLDKHSHADAVQADAREAERQKVIQTPSFLINGELIMPQKYDELIRSINGAVE